MTSQGVTRVTEEEGARLVYINLTKEITLKKHQEAIGNLDMLLMIPVIMSKLRVACVSRHYTGIDMFDEFCSSCC